MPAATAQLHKRLHQGSLQPPQGTNKRIGRAATRAVHPGLRSVRCPLCRALLGRLVSASVGTFSRARLHGNDNRIRGLVGLDQASGKRHARGILLSTFPLDLGPDHRLNIFPTLTKLLCLLDHRSPAKRFSSISLALLPTIFFGPLQSLRKPGLLGLGRTIFRCALLRGRRRFTHRLLTRRLGRAGAGGFPRTGLTLPSGSEVRPGTADRQTATRCLRRSQRSPLQRRRCRNLRIMLVLLMQILLA